MKKYFFYKQFLLLFFIFNMELFAVSETQIKAVFLEKFTHLIQWPQAEEETFTVCVVNDKKFAKALQRIYKTKQFNDKDVVIKSISTTDKLPTCQLLYLGSGINGIQKLLKKASNRPILTVSDQKEYIDKNVMITIFLEQKRFKYIINNKVAKEAGVKISYLLLQSAKEVIQ